MEVRHSETFHGEPMRVEWLLTAKQTLQELQMMTLDMEDKESAPDFGIARGSIAFQPQDGCSDLSGKSSKPGRPEAFCWDGRIPGRRDELWLAVACQVPDECWCQSCDSALIEASKACFWT